MITKRYQARQYYALVDFERAQIEVNAIRNPTTL